MEQFTQAFNLPNVLFTSIFTVLGAILGLVLSRKDDLRTNQTNMVIIKQIINHYPTNSDIPFRQIDNKRKKTSDITSDDNSIWLIIIMSIAVASAYAKYHNEVIQAFIIATSALLLGSIAFAVVLSILNSFDGLSRYWFFVSVAVSVINIVTISLIINQDISTDHGFQDILRIGYYLLGALLIAIVNLMIVMIHLYIFSFNMFIRWQNKFTYRIMKFFDNIFSNTTGVSIVIFIITIFSLGFSSGLLFKLVSGAFNQNFPEL